jgi:hypothetical protein
MGLGIHGAIGGHIYGYIGIHQVGRSQSSLAFKITVQHSARHHDHNICTRIYIIHNKMNSLSR